MTRAEHFLQPVEAIVFLREGYFSQPVENIVILPSRVLGGPGSGNFGHSGRPGEVGGSAMSPSNAGDILSAINQPDGGFTYHAVTGSQPSRGYALSLHKDRERVIDAKDANLVTLAKYAKENADLLSQTNNYLGGWHNPADDKVYLDVSTVVQSEEEALKLGRSAKQLAYFDLEHGKSVEIHEETYAGKSLAQSNRPEKWWANPRRPDSTSSETNGSRANARRNRRGKAYLRDRSLGGPGSGNFGHAGRPGEVGGSAETSAAEVIEDLQTLLGEGKSAYLEDHPTSIKAGKILHSVMAEMKAKGYPLPSRVGVVRRFGKPAGSVSFDRETSASTLFLEVPMIPYDVDLDDAVATGVGFSTTAHTMRDIAIHEMGHSIRGKMEGGPTADFSSYDVRNAALSVSDYAETNSQEFIAEAFVRLYRGETLSPAAMKLYKQLDGPVIR